MSNEERDKKNLEYAEDVAIGSFHKWNNVTGIFQRSTGYMAEIESVILDSVRIGWKYAQKSQMLNELYCSHPEVSRCLTAKGWHCGMCGHSFSTTTVDVSK
jgi:hypothetical protein